MSDDFDNARRERVAFATWMAEASGVEAPLDAETIWRAAAGELSAEQTGRLLDLAARSPWVAEAWRLAREMQTESPDSASADRAVPLRRSPARVAVPLGLAAALLLAVGLWPLLRDVPTPDPPAYRSTAEQGLQAMIDDRSTLPREHFELRWFAPEGEGWRYELRVSTEDLRELVWVADLVAPQYLVSPEKLAGLDSGSRIYWRVEAQHEDGRRRSSATFFATLE